MILPISQKEPYFDNSIENDLLISSFVRHAWYKAAVISPAIQNLENNKSWCIITGPDYF